MVPSLEKFNMAGNDFRDLKTAAVHDLFIKHFHHRTTTNAVMLLCKLISRMSICLNQVHKLYLEDALLGAFNARFNLP